MYDIDFSTLIFTLDKKERVILFACETVNAFFTEGIKINTSELKDELLLLSEKREFEDILSFLDFMMHRMVEKVNNSSKHVYSVVAARFMLLKMYFEVCSGRGDKTPYSNYYSFIQKSVQSGKYDSLLLHISDQQFINSTILWQNDLLYDYSSLQHLHKTYLVKNKTHLYELPQEMFLGISIVLSSMEKEQHRKEYCKRFYYLLSQKKVSLATPILASLRCNSYKNLSSCFIVQIDDNIESIFNSITAIALISKNGGGVGVHVGRIRSEGASIKGKPNSACGIIPFTKIINSTCIAVNQAGKRSAAITVALDVWHKELIKFLEIQIETGDLRHKAFDIFPQIVVCDVFMQCVEMNKLWYMFDPYEIFSIYGVEMDQLYGEKLTSFYNQVVSDVENHVYKLTFITMNARDVLKKIMKTQIETGLPYVFFKDTVNNMNANKHDGNIPCGNLCQESFSNTRFSKVVEDKQNGITKVEDGYFHTCNLASLNLSNLSDEELEFVVKDTNRMLDNAISLTECPVYESNVHNTRYRTMGIGALGLHDYLAIRNIKYSESADVVDKLFERILFFALEGSVALSQERGMYPKFYGSEWHKGMILGKDKDWLLENSSLKTKWCELIDQIALYGIRNAHLLAVAPNTSTSIIQNASASILPSYSKFFLDSNGKTIVPILARYVSSKETFYEESYSNIDIKKVIDVVANAQKWIDQGISFELLFDMNKNLKAQDFYNAIMQIWKSGCKAIYYVRSIQKDTNNISNLSNNSCAGCTL